MSAVRCGIVLLYFGFKISAYVPGFVCVDASFGVVGSSPRFCCFFCGYGFGLTFSCVGVRFSLVVGCCVCLEVRFHHSFLCFAILIR